MVTLLTGNTHTVAGVISYPRDFEEVDPQPITEQKVNVFSQHWFGKLHVGTFHTDQNGEYNFDYKVRHIPFSSTHNLVFELVRETAPYEGFLSFLRSNERTLDSHTFTLQNSDRVANGVNLAGRILEYHSDRPGLKPPEDSSRFFQKWTAGYIVNLAKGAIDDLVKRLFGTIKRKVGGEDTVQSIENRYGLKDPTLKVSPESTLEMILGGIYPCNWLRTATPEQFLCRINWDRYERDGQPDLPNVELRVERRDDQLQILGVSLQFEQGGETLEVRSTDADFEYALGVFNCAAFVKGEVVSHLGMGHIWTEQVAMAVFRHIRPNTPLGQLLHPHLRDVFEINRVGASAIFGPEGVLNVSGLTPRGILEAIGDLLAGMDYTYYEPREPIVSGDRFSQAKRIFWDVVDKTVEDFFAENADAIQGQAHQVVNMSKDLWQHSLPHHSWEGVLDHNNWLDGSEVDPRDGEGRRAFLGRNRAVRPMHTDMDQVDTDKLKQFCKFNLFLATFWHSWVHISQEKWGTNMEFASLAPRDEGRGPYFNTTAADAERQLSILGILLDYDPDTIVENGDGDVLAAFQANLRARAGELRDLDRPIDRVMRSVQI